MSGAVEGGKQPYFISAADGTVLSIAGLWDEWKDPETSEPVLSATLIVTAANDFTRPIHERMPVLLGHQDHEAWLTGKAGVELLRPAPNDLLRMWPVSKRVNVSGRGDDDASLIEPVEDEAIATSY
jgi:putative SOS response-associated peptidase YedK